MQIISLKNTHNSKIASNFKAHIYLRQGKYTPYSEVGPGWLDEIGSWIT